MEISNSWRSWGVEICAHAAAASYFASAACDRAGFDGANRDDYF
jgi:hypothetical protein